MTSIAMAKHGGSSDLAEFASAIGVPEAAVITELKSGSEAAYAWLVGEFHQPVYSVVYRILTDPSDAADTTQEVFLKVFRGMKYFNGQSSLKTWIYRIAIHEASNRRRWWFRHKAKETSIEPLEGTEYSASRSVNAALVDQHKSPFDNAADHEIQSRLEQELRKVSEPYRTAVVLRDIEDLSYEEIAEITQVSLGTVKSRITRGRDALRKRLTECANEVGPQLGLAVARAEEDVASVFRGKRIEVTS